MKLNLTGLISIIAVTGVMAQKPQQVKVIKQKNQNKIDILIGGKPFTSFLYPDSLEKPVLYPVHAANGTVVTRGFPLNPQPGDPTDHPHHIGIWFNYENLNKLDFWNNSYAIKPEKKKDYGWVKTDKILETADGTTGKLTYHANWTDQQNNVILKETTHLEFSGNENERVIDRVTVLKAVKDATFFDAKDGLLGLRLAHALQMPATEDQKFTDNKGNVTIVKAGTDHVANGNYITSAGKHGNDAWSSRAVWCKVYGKMGKDSISISIIDHPGNTNYPTFWHARGYGLFAANPLGEQIFTKGKSVKNLHLNIGESATFKYRIVVANSPHTTTGGQLTQYAVQFALK
ncbi:MAG: PmoA family protein [Mucilaginibacter sp.]|uniref:DUF6807 domain-containing protein n=1 Tax=Mucilaginibacter sp. TaxID=1882438 RepID=UPI00326791B1